MNLRLLPFRLTPFLIVGMAAFYYINRDSPWGQAIKLAIGVTCVVNIAVGVRLFRPRQPRVWWFLATGIVMWFIGAVLYSYEDLTGHAPSVDLGGQPLAFATIFTLSAYPAYIECVRSVPVRHDGMTRARALEFVLVVVALGVIVYAANVRGQGVSEPTLTDLVNAVGLPVADIILLAVLWRLFTAPGERGLSLRLTLWGVAFLVVKDTVLQSLRLHQVLDPLPHTLAFVIWYASIVCIALVPLHPSMADMSPRRAANQRFRIERLMMLGLAMLSPWVVLVLEVRAGRSTGVGVVLAAVAVQMIVVGLRISDLLADLQRKAAALHVAARTDHLTGLLNRRGVDEVLRRPGAGDHPPLCVAILDIDSFKQVNDQHGHQAGDALLARCARVWAEVARRRGTDGTVLARFGGEEFVLLMPDTDARAGWALLEAMRAATPDGHTFSAGLSVWAPGESPDEVLARADTAMYRAKDSGRARTEADPPLIPLAPVVAPLESAAG